MASSTDHGELMMIEFTIESPVSANSAGLAGRCAVVERICTNTSTNSTGHTASTFQARHVVTLTDAARSSW